MVDKSENILVEFDYNNITIIDPNKVVDKDNKVKERYVNQEDLVMYANLECNILPRTKLAIGTANNDAIRTVSIAKINFLNPGNKGKLDNSYTDELTGKGTLQGKGVNQNKLNSVQNPNNSDDYYITQTMMSDGKPGSVDNGLLGITSIQIRQGLDFLPTISMRLVDIKGRALFEAGDNSPYAAFFNLPYPLFYLTIKGYYGKAVRLGLMLQNFTTTYNAADGNFQVDLTFYTYKYTVLTEVTMGALMATPHMYQSRLKIQSSKGGPSKTSKVEDLIVERGYQKIRELYSEYKSKGMIPDDFPEITLIQMKERIENFIKNILDSFTKQNLDPLTDLDTYGSQLQDYQGNVFYYSPQSWFNKYMDTENFFMLNKSGVKVYTFKKEINTSQKKSDAISELKKLINENNTLLGKNKTCGTNGKYSISGKETPCTISNSIKYEIFPKQVQVNDIDFTETYKAQKKSSQPTDLDISNFKADLVKSNTFNSLEINNTDGQNQVKYNYFVFEGPGSFIDLIDKINKDLKTKREEIQEKLTIALSELLQSKDNGIGFVPTIRNVLAVVFANGEAFLRLMDDVHTKAWAQRDNKIRKNVVFNKQVAGASADNKNSGDDVNQPIYPWPQVIKETTGENGQEKYELRYPGDNDIIGETKGFLSDVWPEIEFVEEFLRALVEKEKPPSPFTPSSNSLTEPNRVSLNAIEFPIGNEVFNNKQDVKFFYEIYERVLFTSHYSRLSRASSNVGDTNNITNVIAEAETTNIKTSLGTDNPFLIKKLKEYGFTGDNFERVLRQISNEGIGESWQNYIRGIFNTTYIKNTVDNSGFEFISSDILTESSSQPLVSLNNENLVVQYITNSTTSNNVDLEDIYPFTDTKWINGGLADGGSSNNNSAFNTTKGLTYNTKNKVISNFTDAKSVDVNRPITNFVYKTINAPVVNKLELSNFYSTRTYDAQLPTEGDIIYHNYSGGVSTYQTTSMFNTPYFINSIQEGVNKFKNKELYPYVSSAYLFLNSLPLTTLREKSKTYEGSSQKDLDYLFATLKKFGAVHKMPYAWILKMGSIWNRYKTFTNSGVDILDNCWKNFDANINYDPVNSDPTKVYTFTIPGQTGSTSVVLQNTVDTSFPLFFSNVSADTTTINTGFYPKLINDFNVFYQGFEVYSGYTNADIQNGFNKGVTLNNVVDSVINGSNGVATGSTRFIKVIPWSVSVKTPDKISSYIMPSQGSLFNQTFNECFTPNGTLQIEVTGNTSMYNGSVRLFWSAPNYGYFDNTKLVKPTPSQYLKQIFTGQSSQQNYSFNGVTNDYTNISEMFSVFEKNVLDKFETEFLNFSKSIYTFDENESEVDTDTEKSFGNFQKLMTSMMVVPTVNGLSSDGTVTDIQTRQLTNLSNLITNFLNYDVVFKYGNPGGFDKRLFYTFSKHPITSPITWDYYTSNTANGLPSQTTLALSQTTYPDAWNALKTYVGFSDIPELVYKDSGSYITDFFIDCNVAFTVESITNLYPIIKIYATQKLKDPTLNYDKFITLVNDYLTSIDSFNTKILNNLMIKIQKELPNVNDTPQQKTQSVLDSTQTKVELWESFKATNDKWIAGNDFKTKTLFEDILLLDRASRDVGDKILVDVIKLKDRLTDINVKTNMLTYIQTILVENNFVVMNIPSYINFYNVQDAVKNAKPSPEGTLEFANTMFGTFLNVDYRNSSAKMVCFYGGKPSEQLDLKNNVDYRFRNDAFDLRRASDNPLLENQIGKKDWDKSNKVVGFNVDMGPQNQSIFQGFNVSQNPGKSTAESLEVINQMANQAGNRGGSTQSTSLYNVYKNRSYSCTITMMGNAIIQPTMYFNLRNVPMFSGPYMITSVNHTINPGHFETVIEGIRQPTASLPKVENYIQSLKTTLLKTITDKLAQEKSDKVKASSTGTTSNSNIKKQKEEKVKELTNKGGTKSDNTQTCKPISNYDKYTLDKPSATTVNYNDVISLITTNTDNRIRYAVFAKMYLSSANGSQLKTVAHNYSGVNLNPYWGATGDKYFMTKYYCDSSNSTDGKVQTAYAFFNSVEDHINFLMERYQNRASMIKSINAKDIAKFLILYSDNGIPKNEDEYTTMNPTDVSNIESRVQEAINIINPVTGNVSATPPPANVPAPTPFISKYTYTVSNNPILESLKVTIDPAQGDWEIFSARWDYKITAPCDSGTGINQDLNAGGITTNKKEYFVDTESLLRDFDCDKKDFKGDYTLQLRLWANPVTSGGQLDTTRQQAVKTFSYKFKL